MARYRVRLNDDFSYPDWQYLHKSWHESKRYYLASPTPEDALLLPSDQLIKVIRYFLCDCEFYFEKEQEEDGGDRGDDYDNNFDYDGWDMTPLLFRRYLPDDKEALQIAIKAIEI